jgi:hypothetical protein
VIFTTASRTTATTIIDAETLMRVQELAGHATESAPGLHKPAVPERIDRLPVVLRPAV